MSWAWVLMGARLRQGVRRAAILAGIVVVAIGGVVAILWGEP